LALVSTQGLPTDSLLSVVPVWYRLCLQAASNHLATPPRAFLDPYAKYQLFDDGSGGLNMDEFIDAREVVASLSAEYEACEHPEYVRGGPWQRGCAVNKRCLHVARCFGGGGGRGLSCTSHDSQIYSCCQRVDCSSCGVVCLWPFPPGMDVA